MNKPANRLAGEQTSKRNHQSREERQQREGQGNPVAHSQVGGDEEE